MGMQGKPGAKGKPIGMPGGKGIGCRALTGLQGALLPPALPATVVKQDPLGLAALSNCCRCAHTKTGTQRQKQPSQPRRVRRARCLLMRGRCVGGHRRRGAACAVPSTSWSQTAANAATALLPVPATVAAHAQCQHTHLLLGALFALHGGDLLKHLQLLWLHRHLLVRLQGHVIISLISSGCLGRCSCSCLLLLGHLSSCRGGCLHLAAAHCGHGHGHRHGHRHGRHHPDRLGPCGAEERAGTR